MYRKSEPLKRGVLFLGLAAIYLVACLLTSAAASRFWLQDTSSVTVVYVIAWFGAMFACVPLLSETKTRWGWMITAWLFGGIVMAVPLFVGPETLLAVRGVPTHAQIVDVDAFEDDPDRLYTLRDDSGRLIPGQLKTDGGYSVGRHVEVVVDPDGLVHPKLAAQIAAVDPSTGPTVFAVVFGLQLVFCWLAAKPRGQPLVVASISWWQRRPFTERDLAKMPWVQVGLGVFIVLLGLLLAIMPAWSSYELNHHGIEGWVQPRDCTAANSTSWTCAGPFTSRDGKVLIDRVVISPDLDHQPRRPVPARVMDAEATSAYTESGWVGQLFAGLAFIAIGIWWMRIGIGNLAD